MRHFEDEEGCENCKEEDEERKEGEGTSSNIIRQGGVPKGKHSAVLLEQREDENDSLDEESKQGTSPKVQMVD